MADTQEEIELREQMVEVLMEQIRTGEKGIDADIKLYLEHTKLGKSIAGTSKAVTTFTGGIKDSAKAMGSSTGNFNDLSAVVTGSIKAISGLLSAIPLVGKAFAALGDAAAETATFAIGQVQANFESFTELSKAGQIGAEGITGMAERFRAANLPLATYTKLLAENSENLGFFSVSALQGGKTFSKTMIDMAGETGRPLRRLGLSVDEIGKTVVDFQVMQRRNGILDQLTQQQITKGTMEYAKELDLIAKLTGKSREGLQKEREEAMSDARFRASLAELSVEEQEKHKSALSQITDPTLRRAYMDQLSGFTNSTASVSMEIAGMGQSIRDAQDLIKSGGGSTEAVNVMKEQARLATEVGGTFQQYAKVMESGTGVMGNFADLSDFAVSAIKTQQEIAKAQAELMAAEGSKTDLLITAMMDMQAGISEMNYFFIATDAATTVISKFSETMRDTIEFISEKLLSEGEGLKPKLEVETTYNRPTYAKRKYIEKFGSDKEKEAMAAELEDAKARALELQKKPRYVNRQTAFSRWLNKDKDKGNKAEEASLSPTPNITPPAKKAPVTAPVTASAKPTPTKAEPPTKAEDLVTEKRKPIKWKKITPEMISDKKDEIKRQELDNKAYKKKAQVNGYTEAEITKQIEMTGVLTEIKRQLVTLTMIAERQNRNLEKVDRSVQQGN